MYLYNHNLLRYFPADNTLPELFSSVYRPGICPQEVFKYFQFYWRSFIKSKTCRVHVTSELSLSEGPTCKKRSCQHLKVVNKTGNVWEFFFFVWVRILLSQSDKSVGKPSKTWLSNVSQRNSVSSNSEWTLSLLLTDYPSCPERSIPHLGGGRVYWLSSRSEQKIQEVTTRNLWKNTRNYFLIFRRGLKLRLRAMWVVLKPLTIPTFMPFSCPAVLY